MRFLTDRIKLLAASALALVTGLALAFTLFGNWSLERDVKAATERLEVTQGQLSRCEALAGNLEASVVRQSAAVEAWKAEAERVKAEGERATRQARERARSLEVQLLGARRATVNPGETQCEAAERLILERVG